MNEINLMEAFGSYKTKPTRRVRSAMTSEGALVVSCWYAGFHRAELDILRYEEDLSSKAGEITGILRAHLSEAKEHDYHVHLIVAVEAPEPKPVDRGEAASQRSAHTTYYTRKDLVGRVTSFDGQRFVIDFRKAEVPAPIRGKSAKGAAAKRLFA